MYEPFGQRSQKNASLAQHGGDFDEMAQGPAEPIKPPHHERIARPERGERLHENRARGVSTGRRFLEDNIDRRARQRVSLQRCRLGVRQMRA